jgi:hypothetical protein
MKALVLALALLVAQTIEAGAYVVCNATPYRAACIGPRVGTSYGWRGWGWRRWGVPYAGLYGYGWGGPYAGPPAPYGWRGPYAGPYFRPGPYF